MYIAAGGSASLSSSSFGTTTPNTLENGDSQDIYIDSLGTLLLAEKDQSGSTNQYTNVEYVAGSDVFVGCRRGYFGKLFTESNSTLSLPAYNSADFINKFPGVRDCNPSSYGVQSCCSQCEEGKISFSGSHTSCLLCPPGSRSNEDRTECLNCESGTASLGGSASCDNCSPTLGEFSITEGDVVCSRILPGHYFDDDTKKHLACPAGTFSADGASNLAGCAACGGGSFSLASAAYCTMVSSGKNVTFSDGLRVGEEDCLEGMFSTGAKDSCSSCGDGWAPIGADSCVAPGNYWDEVDKDERSCPAGTKSTQGAANLAGCETCRGDGQYSIEAGATTCSVVGAGTSVVKNEDGNGVGVTNCLANYYSTGAKDACSPCDGGHSEP